MQPAHNAPVAMELRLPLKVVVPFDAPEVQRAVRLEGIDDQVARPDLKREPDQDARPGRNRSWFRARIGRCQTGFDVVFLWPDGSQIAQSVPADADETPLNQIELGVVVVKSPGGHERGGPSTCIA